jgi:phosphoribosylaminoimidazole-succinocarboxamide synthase
MKPMPPSVASTPLVGLELIHQGKVRDTYRIPGHPGLLFVVVTDRLSVHDAILPSVVPYKGVVLNQMDIFWRTKLAHAGGRPMRSDLVASGSAIDAYLPEDLRGDRNLHARARVIINLDMYPAEIIIRGLLTGTALTAYKKDGIVCGITLPTGMVEWDEFPTPLFTPTTKAKVGHDVHMTVTEFEKQFGTSPVDIAVHLFKHAREHVRSCGFELADTKLEEGAIGDDDVIADELFTPDSSRYILLEDLQSARTTGRKPPSYDKQPVRDWVTQTYDIDANTPLTDELVQRVQSAPVDPEVISVTSTRFCELLRRITGLHVADIC